MTQNELIATKKKLIDSEAKVTKLETLLAEA